ncbi:MAG: sigma-70 family RNA polymerase sigma factor [Gemmatimonadales bacterium]
MNENELLAGRFEQHRAHLRAVATRMLGTQDEADDAVQEAWLRVSRAGAHDVDNLGGWLTTVVSRVCLDVLRSRNSRREEPLVADGPNRSAEPRGERTAEDDAVLADSVGMAMQVVLERLPPAERVAFVLHDMFDLTFDEIAPIIERSPVATRQLASRARRRVRGTPPSPPADRDRHRQIAEAFLAASRNADIEGLLAVLDPDVVFRADAAAVKLGGDRDLQGAAAIANAFSGKAKAARAALINDAVGVIVDPRGKLLLILALTFEGGRITEIEAVADRASLAELDLVPFSAGVQ